jgi:hypothetical protein
VNNGRDSTVFVFVNSKTRSVSRSHVVGKPGTGTETVLAEVLAGVVRKEVIPLDSHFFDDLGANSLVMAHFCARVRKRDDLPSVSMRDVYGYPTIRSLAAALAICCAGRCSSSFSPRTACSPESSRAAATNGFPAGTE